MLIFLMGGWGGYFLSLNNAEIALLTIHSECMCLLLQGEISVALHPGNQRSSKKSAADRPDQTLWKPEERDQRHQTAQVVHGHRLDCALREKGNGTNCRVILTDALCPRLQGPLILMGQDKKQWPIVEHMQTLVNRKP